MQSPEMWQDLSGMRPTSSQAALFQEAAFGDIPQAECSRTGTLHTDWTVSRARSPATVFLEVSVPRKYRVKQRQQPPTGKRLSGLAFSFPPFSVGLWSFRLCFSGFQHLVSVAFGFGFLNTSHLQTPPGSRSCRRKSVCGG